MAPSIETRVIGVEEGLVRPTDVHKSFYDEFMRLSPNSRRVVSPVLLEDIRALESNNAIQNLFDADGLTQ